MCSHQITCVEKYLPAKDVAVRVGYTSDYVTRLAREEKVDAERRGRQWFVDPNSVKLFLLQMDEKKRSRQDEIRDERLNERAQFHTKIADEEIAVALQATKKIAFLQTAIVTLCLFVGANLFWFSFEQNLNVDHIATGVTSIADSLVGLFVEPIPDMFSQVASFAFVDEEVGVNSFSVASLESDVDSYLSAGFQGVVILNEEGVSSDEFDELRSSFSDEVKVDFADDHTGMITPVFRERDGDSYRFLLVPVSHSETK